MSIRSQLTSFRATGVALVCVVSMVQGFSAGSPEADLERRFSQTVHPFLQNYCVTCHGHDKPKAQFDLSPYSNLAAVVKDHAHWELMLERLGANEMPPEEAKQHPTPSEQQKVIQWIRDMRRHEAQKNAGDPGLVLARRLSNAEYDNTIRDLTGVDIRPTKEFPVDPANQEGFDNSGESLAMSPSLVKKYLQAARQVADHLVLKPDGFDFAPHPVIVETDRDKYSILRIVDFYQRQPTDYADYFEAAWRYQHRSALGKRRATLAEIAAESKLSARYLELVWATLTEKPETVGPMAKLQGMWRALPKPNSRSVLVQHACSEMRDFVVDLRTKLKWNFPNLELKGISSGGQCFIMWKNQQYATHRRQLNVEALEIGGVPRPRPLVKSKDDKKPAPEPPPPVPDPDLFVPSEEAARAPYIASFRRFCDVFPDTFYVSERGRMHMDDPGDKGRLLSAGFHNMMGYFRDDVPLCELILDEQGKRELDRLWLDFDFVAFVPEREHIEFIFYERAESRSIKGPEFDFARSEDKDITSEAKINRLAEVYLARARSIIETNGGNPVTIEAIVDHFATTSANIRSIEKSRAAAEPSHLQSLVTFAERAYRRPLADSERQELVDFYKSLRKDNGLTHEEAIRDGVVSVLMSPHFCFRIDLGGGAAKPASAASNRKTTPLTDYELANRLSYFLWSSMPDAELLAKAAAGELHRPEVLVTQARRMLKDARVRGLATEFLGNWLDIRRFEEHNAVDRERFADFNDDLRSAMFEEPIRFFMNVAAENRSVMDFLYGKHTFVNPVLARHYRIPYYGNVVLMTSCLVPPSAEMQPRRDEKPKYSVTGPDIFAKGTNINDHWGLIDDANRFGRGGLLPMAVFLTKNAPGLRTSPVKRGYWMVRRVLGEHIPPPPAVVPELPHDEAQLGNLTLRDVLAKHREDKSCAACHSRFDSFGLVFEGYGPVGELRTKDLGGRPVDVRAPFPGGVEASGLDGLKAYVKKHRQEDFLDNLCGKLLAYGLGRTLMLSDDSTIREMRTRLAKDGYRFGSLVESVVTSPQFLNKRSSDDLARK